MNPKKKRTPTKTQRPAVNTQRPQSSENESRLALGALLGFYRRIKGISQGSLATDAGLKPSMVAMIESGQRVPSSGAIAQISRVLGLDIFQRQQLELVCNYDEKSSAGNEQWFLPEDILTGTPIFLRKLHREAAFQRTAAVSETWIVTNRPLALDGEMYDVLKQRLTNEQTNFIYFLDNTAGEMPFRALWSRLAADDPALKGFIPKKLRCVLTPTSFCLSHYAICNPGQPAGMFGRLVVYAGGRPVGLLSMDSQQVLRAYHLLSPIYDLCVAKPDDLIETEYGHFRLLTPRF